MQRKYLFIAFLNVFIVLNSQNSGLFTHEAMAEKIYLQLNNEIYENDETIWLKAILVNAATHKRDRTSGVLQVDLVDSSGEVSVSRLVKIDQGIGHGQITLSNRFKPGVYLIRANTNWNQNFKSDFGFEKYIQIFSSTENERQRQPIQNLKRIEVTENQQAVSLEIYPKLIDELHRGSLLTVINYGSRSDTLSLKEGRDDAFNLNFELGSDIAEVGVEFITKNRLTFSQKVALKPNTIALQFFPEGGKMVQGFDCKVGFKAVGADGRGKMVSGEIRNKSGKLVASFRSDSLGMGHFEIRKAETDQGYFAVVNIGFNDQLKFRLPKVHVKGNVLSVEEIDNRIILKVASNVLQDGLVTLEGLCRGYKYFKESFRLRNGVFQIIIPKKRFPEGPVVFTIYGEGKTPLAERLFFNERPDRRLNIVANGVKDFLEIRERHELEISITQEDTMAAMANMSMLVVNENELGNLRQTKDNILSYLLLSSELKGKIERPGVYFTNNPNYSIDDLMLTQGWRNYKYVSPVRSTTFKMENNLTAKGVINPKTRRKEKEELALSLLVFDKDRSIYATQVEAPGHFSIDLEDIYGNEIDLAFQVNGKNKSKNYAVALNPRKKLPVSFNYDELLLAEDSITKSMLEMRKTLKEQENTYLNLNGVTLLDEVFLEGYLMTPERKKISDRYGMPDVVIEGENIEKKKQQWSYGLFNILEDFFPDKIWVRTLTDGQIEVKSIRESGPKNGAPTLIVVDGVPVRRFEYFLLRNMQADQITSVEVIDNADRFGTLYRQVYPDERPPIPSRGSVVAIYSKRGTGLNGTLKPENTNLNFDKMQVFAFEKEFYVPNYEDEDKNSVIVPDLRSPVYWQPMLETEQNGLAEFSYFHSDNTGNFVIIIEAISADGQIGYEEYMYSVESKN